jgi:hypothetical protein
MALPAALCGKSGKTYAASVWVRANRPGTLVEVNLLEPTRRRSCPVGRR